MHPDALIECVPNFSEGRDPVVVAEIVGAIAGVPGIVVLDQTSDPDHNRSVVTFAGTPDAAMEAAVQGVATAARLIDLRRHAGVHPRVGAADVVPFVPLEGATLEQCVDIAHATGHEIWKRCGVPVYFYEAAALRHDRVRLEHVRRGGFDALQHDAPKLPERRPDVGGPELHPSAGASIVGARKFLIAFNINLDCDDVALARDIAKRIRASSGGLPCVKALGLPLAARNLVQVSMNLTDFRTTSLADVFQAVRSHAGQMGVKLAGCELIGLIPADALKAVEKLDIPWENFRPDMVLEQRLADRRGRADVK